MKRAVDIMISTVGIIVLTPAALLLWGLGRIDGDRGPMFHSSIRVGEGGQLFSVLKLRSMRVGTAGPGITVMNDSRVTRIGRVLRRFKIDEFPQLINVARGEMSLVGPRPEDPQYVDWKDPLHAKVFTARPGITGLAQLRYPREEELLGGHDPERTYRETLLPAKLKLDAWYLDHRSLRLDLAILWRTLKAILS